MTGTCTTPRPLPELALFAASALWGASFLATKLGMADTGPFGFVALRFFAAAVVLTAIFPKAVRSLGRTDVVAGVIVAATAVIGYATQAVALQTAPSGRVAFLSALYVPLVPVLQFVLFRKQPPLAIWLGVALSIVGVAVISGGEAAGLTLTNADLLSLASAVAIALEVVLIGRFVRQADPLRIAIVTAGATALFALGLALLASEPPPRATLSLVSIVAAYGAATAFIQFAMSWGQRRVDSSRAAMIYSTEPVFAGLIGFAAGEALGVSDIVGGAIIVAGVVVGSLRWYRLRRAYDARRARRHARDAAPDRARATT